MSPEEREKRASEEYLAPRRANGFGGPEAGAKGVIPGNAERNRIQSARRHAIKQLLREALDGPTMPTAPAKPGLQVVYEPSTTRVQAALRVLDDAMAERTKGGRVTVNAMQAARYVINHRYGRPAQKVEVESTSSDERLEAIDARLVATAAALGSRNGKH